MSFLEELAEEICKGKDLNFEHFEDANGKVSEDVIDIWHLLRDEYIRIQLFDDDGMIEVSVIDGHSNYVWDEHYQLTDLDPNKVREESFKAMKKVVKNEHDIAKEAVRCTEAFLKELS